MEGLEICSFEHIRDDTCPELKRSRESLLRAWDVLQKLRKIIEVFALEAVRRPSARSFSEEGEILSESLALSAVNEQQIRRYVDQFDKRITPAHQESAFPFQFLMAIPAAPAPALDHPVQGEHSGGKG